VLRDQGCGAFEERFFGGVAPHHRERCKLRERAGEGGGDG
jgi:hypothetical protein